MHRPGTTFRDSVAERRNSDRERQVVLAGGLIC